MDEDMLVNEAKTGKKNMGRKGKSNADNAPESSLIKFK